MKTAYVITAIEPASAEGYFMLMRSLALKLVALVAVLMLPLGMAAATAEAHSAASAAAMPLHHDGAHHGDRQAPASRGECTMACSAALPAVEMRPLQNPAVMRVAEKPSPAAKLAGILLELATPPPKLA